MATFGGGAVFWHKLIVSLFQPLLVTSKLLGQSKQRRTPQKAVTLEGWGLFLELRLPIFTQPQRGLEWMGRHPMTRVANWKNKKNLILYPSDKIDNIFVHGVITKLCYDPFKPIYLYKFHSPLAATRHATTKISRKTTAGATISHYLHTKQQLFFDI